MTDKSAVDEIEKAPVAETTPAATPTAQPGSAIPQEELDRLTADIVVALKTVFDPEIPADVYELGLIYKIDVDDDRLVTVEMTLTSPGCPVAGEMPTWEENALAAVPGVSPAVWRFTFVGLTSSVPLCPSFTAAAASAARATASVSRTLAWP